MGVDIIVIMPSWLDEAENNFLTILKIINSKDDYKKLIQITKEEAAIIRHKYPNVYIAKTVHKRYLPEIYKYLKLIPDNIEAKKILDDMESTIGYEE